MSDVAGLDGCVAPDGDPLLVEETRHRLVSAVEAQQLSDLFRLLGDQTRTRLLYAPCWRQANCACAISPPPWRCRRPRSLMP